MHEWKRSDRVPRDLTPNEFSLAIDAKRTSGKEFLDLTVANPSAAGLTASDSELKEALASGPLNVYDPHPRGLREAREEVARWLGRSGISISPDRLWLTSGTSEAYGYLFRLLGNPGDEFLIPSPSYPLFEHLLNLEGLAPVTFPLVHQRSWKLDLNALHGLVGPKTRGMILVHPNNPTGSYFSDDEVQKILEFCAWKRLSLIVDEVFLSYPWDGRSRTSFHTARAECPVFVLNGLSKQFGLPQLKVSWIHLNVSERAGSDFANGLDWISDSYLSVSAPVQVGLGRLLALGERLHERIADRVTSNLREVRKRTAACKDILDVSGDGGWNTVLQLPDSIDEERFVLNLLERDGILVQPGFLFDLPFQSSVVVSLLPPVDAFSKGMAGLFDRAISTD